MRSLTLIALAVLMLLSWTAAENTAASVRISCAPLKAKLLHRVYPIYPKEAKKAGVQGKVALRCFVAKDGSIKSVNVISGPKALIQVSVDAVKEWRYEPLLVNGKPVEAETQIDINFVISKAKPMK